MGVLWTISWDEDGNFEVRGGGKRLKVISVLVEVGLGSRPDSWCGQMV